MKYLYSVVAFMLYCVKSNTQNISNINRKISFINGVIDLHPDPNYNIPIKKHEINQTSLPDAFDSSQNWPQCASLINNIRNQGACGSCWAFATTSVMSDRFCIQTNGVSHFKYSPEDVFSCCVNCRNGCLGGWPALSFQYWIDNGIVSGGDYQSEEGCKPYGESEFLHNATSPCVEQCTNPGYSSGYNSDKRYGVRYYQVDASAEQIQTEILNRGPVYSHFVVYSDFYDYQSGVYHHVSGGETGSHAIKIIGWGTENGTPYWLVVNSWGKNWGQLGGFFKIRRGTNECGIEANVLGADAVDAEFEARYSTQVGPKYSSPVTLKSTTASHGGHSSGNKSVSYSLDIVLSTLFLVFYIYCY